MVAEKKSRSFNFLIELLVVILFFSLATIVCVELFTEGKKRGELSNAISEAVMIAESNVERLKNYQGEELEELFDCSKQDNACLIEYDENWNIVKEGIYTLTIQEANKAKVINEWRTTNFIVSIVRKNDQKILVELESVALWKEDS